ncbi:MAG: hypothetical protein H6606_03240 [Flavobacteriales bacterium]|nr:hypothetical protein [Flavobacteriales bacterium]
MKNNQRGIQITALMALILSVLFNSCQTCEKTIRYMGLVPEYVLLEEMRSSAEVGIAKPIKEPGKIYVYGDLLFVNDVDEGIHVIDNQDASNPVPLKFIQLLGNRDIAVIDDHLYADQGPDLTVWDISDLNNIQLVSRTKAILNRDKIKSDSFPIRYVEKEIVEVIDDADCGSGGWGWLGGNVDFAFSGAENQSRGVTGLAGSMSRFTYVSGKIYIVDQFRLKVLDVSNPASPILEGDQELNSEVETIFPYENHLFLGTTTGMLIYNWVNSPSRPTFVSSFWHIRGCDPVVVVNDLAYVTLRGGSRCGAAEDALHIVDVSDIRQPGLLISYSMQGPYGLAANEDLLMICDGSAGLKTFNRSKTFELHNHLLSVLQGKTTYDVILDDEHAILSAKEGIFQYDFSDPENPQALGTLFSR